MRAITALIAALVVLTPASAQDGPPADWRLGQGRETFVRDSPATPQVRIDIGWNGSLIAWRWNPIRVHLTGGERPVGGQVVVEHTGGGGDAVRIGAPYGVAPGSTTTVEALVPASSYIDHLVVVITDENGRQLRRIAYADWREPSTTPPPVEHSATQVGVVGDTRLPLAVGGWSVRKIDGDEEDEDPSVLETAVRVAARDASELPIEAMGYDALDALVIGPGALRAAPETSVRAAREWVERGGRIALIAADAGSDWRRWLPEGLIELGELRDNGGGSARPITLSDDAERLGWRVHAPDPALATAMADGPVGLGWAVVLGGAPAGATASRESAASAWGLVLGELLDDRLAALALQQDRYWWAYSSPAGIDAALDAIAHDLGAGAGVHTWPVLTGLAILALLLGPVDWFVLKRLRLRHRSWLTALGWIGLASGLAYALPLATLSMETGVRAVAVEDGVVGSPVGVRTAALGVLPGEGGAAAFDENARASWWRPVSAGWNGPRFGGAVPLAQAPGDSVGAAPLLLSLRIRALKTLLEEGDAPAPAQVGVRRTGDGYVVTLPGDLEAPSSAALLSPEGWWTLAPAEGGVLRTDGEAQAEPPPAWAPVAERTQSPWLSQPGVAAQRADAPGAATGLPSARLRGALLERRVERGGWCVVHLGHADAPARRTLAGAPALERRVVRIAAPIEVDEPEGSR